MAKTGWGAAEKAAEEVKERQKNGGKFLTLENDEDKAVVAFLGEPCVRETVWENNKSVAYNKNHEERGVSPVVKFSFNVYNKEGQKVQIFEQGSDWFNKVLACKNKYGLDKNWFEIKRNGAKGDKNTRYTVLFEDKMSTEEFTQMRDIENKDGLYDLSKEIESAGSEDDKDTKSDRRDKEKKSTDGPISDKQKDMIVSRLKELPTSATKAFMGEFRIDQIKALPASAFEAALSMLSKLEAEAKGGEVDPFA